MKPFEVYVRYAQHDSPEDSVSYGAFKVFDQKTVVKVVDFTPYFSMAVPAYGSVYESALREAYPEQDFKVVSSLPEKNGVRYELLRV